MYTGTAGTDLNPGPEHFSSIYCGNFEVIIYINAGPLKISGASSQYHGVLLTPPPSLWGACMYIIH